MIRILLLGFVLLEATNLHATFTSAKALRLSSLKKQCEEQGRGKSCYDYARMLWNEPKNLERKQARQYLLRGCELGYKGACQAYHAHAFVLTPNKKTKRGLCFHDDDLKKIKFTDDAPGLVLREIAKRSFWDRVGLENGDHWVELDNSPVRNLSDGLQALKSSKRRMIFYVLRHGERMTLIYTCR